MVGICRQKGGLFIVRVCPSQDTGHGRRRVVARMEMIGNGGDGRLFGRRTAVGAPERHQDPPFLHFRSVVR